MHKIHGYLRGRRRATALVVGVTAVGLLLALPPVAAAAAPTDGSASVSDRSPQPGQTVTVSASGLGPGKPATIEFQPGATLLATVTVEADGGFSRDVQIPAGTTDGAKLIVIKSIGTNGRFARLEVGVDVSGPATTGRLSDETLVPSQAFRVQGTRFYAGTAVVVVLYPEGVVLSEHNAGADGRFDVAVRMPEALLNGKHGFVIAGIGAGGHFAVLKLFATVTGGLGGTVKGDPFEGVADPYVTPTTAPTTTSSTRPRATSTTAALAPADPSGGISGFALLIILVLVLVLIAIAITWLRSSEGQAWRRERDRRHRDRQRLRQVG